LSFVNVASAVGQRFFYLYSPNPDDAIRMDFDILGFLSICLSKFLLCVQPLLLEMLHSLRPPRFSTASRLTDCRGLVLVFRADFFIDQRVTIPRSEDRKALRHVMSSCRSCLNSRPPGICNTILILFFVLWLVCVATYQLKGQLPPIVSFFFSLFKAQATPSLRSTCPYSSIS